MLTRLGQGDLQLQDGRQVMDHLGSTIYVTGHPLVLSPALVTFRALAVDPLADLLDWHQWLGRSTADVCGVLQRVCAGRWQRSPISFVGSV
jgi:hypothetical protein